MKKKTQPSYFVPALEKGLDILEALALAPTPLPLAELARSLNRTSSELFRMIDALEKRGYIGRDQVSGGYQLTLKLYGLAHTHTPVDRLLRVAEFPMRQLADSIHESCHLSVLDRGDLLVVAQAESPEPVRLSVEVGYRVAPLNTVSGRLLVAFLNPEDQEHFLRSDRTYLTMRKKQREELHATIKKIRSEGYHLAESARRTGLDVSCLIGNPRVGVAAALGVPFLAGGTNEGKERKLISSVRKCADAITTALGFGQTKNHSSRSNLSSHEL
jgi:DNA-binding IclR family transcriptional regulator